MKFSKFNLNTVCFFILLSVSTIFSEGALSQTETELPLKGLTIICDLDYTFLDYASRGELSNIGEVGALEESIVRFFKRFRTVYGMDNLLMTLQNKGAEIKFLSVRPEAHEKLIRKYLNKIGFENATLQLAGGHLLNKSMYKNNHIESIAKANPEQMIILIGDNLHRDLEVFEWAHHQESMHGKIFATFVRPVRKSKPIPKKFIEFSDATEIATLFQQIGFLSESELGAILSRKKIKPISSGAGICRNLFN